MHQMLRFIVMLAFALPSLALAQADLRQPSGKEWLTIGGDWSNSRYSTLTQINRENVKSLKAAWMVNLGSGIGTKYSMEGTPIVKDGVMYFATGNDDVFALDARTGALIWEHRSGIDRQNGTGDASSAGPRAQEYIRPGEIGGLKCEVQRVATTQPLFGAGIGELRAVVLVKNRQTTQIGDGAAGGDTVDPDARPDFHRELPDQPDNRMLRRGIKSAAAAGIQSRDRRGEDHRPFGLDQLG